MFEGLKSAGMNLERVGLKAEHEMFKGHSRGAEETTDWGVKCRARDCSLYV